MQQFWVLLEKELRSCFRSNMAYVIFFIYLFVSTGAEFYFGSYLAMHDSAMYSLFYVQPVILALAVPALTMRSWSEEYKSGTAEFLLTQPLAYYIPVLAKFAAAFLFCAGMTFFFLPFILYTSGWLSLDAGNIILSYAGVWGIIAVLCASGCLISALNRSIIITYIFSVFTAALWMVLPQFRFYEVYGNFMFAEVGVFDIVYFIAAAAVLLGLNVAVLNFAHLADRHKRAKFAALVCGALAALVLTDIAVYNFFRGKADLTAGGLYTPKKESREIIGRIDKPLTVDIYAARDYANGNTDYFHYMQQVVRFAGRLERLSGGMITVNVNYVEAFSQLEEEILQRGLYFEENNRGSKNYFGAFISDRDGHEVVIRQFLRQRRPLLEKDFVTAFLKITEPQRVKNIGVYLDPMQNIEGLEGIMLSLENDYNVLNVSGTEYKFLKNADLLVLINPKKLAPYFMYALDQYVMRGGKLAVFFDFFTESQSEVVNEEKISVIDFLNKWGVKLKPEFTDDGQAAEGAGRQFAALAVNKAVPFEINNGTLKITPYIRSESGLLATVLEGSLPSAYTDNPYKNSGVDSVLPEFIAQSLPESAVAVVSDVDMLEDSFWISGNSPDRNPYSVIEKTANGAVFRSLIDYMCGNEIYQSLPYNDYLLNKDSIGENLNKQIYSRYEAKYTALKNKIADAKLLLYEAGGEDMDKMNELLQVSSAGRDIAADEKTLRGIEYKMASDYRSAVVRMAVLLVAVLPLAAVLLLLLGVKLRDRKNAVRVKEKFYE